MGAAGDFVAAAYRAVAGQGKEGSAGDGWFRLGRLSRRQGRHDVALAEFSAGRALAERARDDEMGARIENGVGAVHFARGDHAAARRSYSIAGALTRDDVMRGLGAGAGGGGGGGS